MTVADHDMLPDHHRVSGDKKIGIFHRHDWVWVQGITHFSQNRNINWFECSKCGTEERRITRLWSE